MENYEKYMRLALGEAQRAESRDEVPIGAVIVCRGRVIASAHNLTETLIDPTAHAEMQALTAACNYLGGKYLQDCTLFVTVEPCPMCAAALRWAQIGEVVYGASDEKFGYSTISPRLLHPKTKVTHGILKEDSATIIHEFFARKRK